MGHTDIRTTYNLYRHLFPDREDELVAKLDSRHDRALEASREAEDRQDQENAFEFSLSSRQSRAPRGGHRKDESRPDQGKRSVGLSGCYSNLLAEFRALLVDLRRED
jgi:hypothetical protein